MYAGQVVEQGTVDEVLLDPKRPVHDGAARVDPERGQARRPAVSVIKGTVPNPFNMPPACRFEPRCPYAWDLCKQDSPDLYRAGPHGQLARCHLHTPAGASRPGCGGRGPRDGDGRRIEDAGRS